MRLDTQDIRNIGYFESVTGACVLDSISEGNSIAFLVKKRDMGRALGKSGSTVNKIRKALGKQVFIFEDNDDPDEFVKGLYKPQIAKNIEIKDDEVVVHLSKSDRLELNSKKARFVSQFIQRRLQLKRVTIITR